MKEYDKEILREHGYIVELSNRGEKVKNNPNFFNPEKQRKPCVAEGCNNQTIAVRCLCRDHGKLKDYPLHTKDWIGRVIIPGKTREECKTWALPHLYITNLLIEWIGNDKERGERVDRFIDEAIKEIHTQIPDATTFQKTLDGEIDGGMHPDEFAKKTYDITELYFPKSEFGDEMLEGHRIKFKDIPLGKVPLRVVASSMILALGCEESNRGDSRGCIIHNLKPKYANIFMPLGLYLLRRKGATESEAKISMRG